MVNFSICREKEKYVFTVGVECSSSLPFFCCSLCCHSYVLMPAFFYSRKQKGRVCMIAVDMLRYSSTYLMLETFLFIYDIMHVLQCV